MKIRHIVFISLIILSLLGCMQNSSHKNQSNSIIQNTEAREDSLKMASALAERSKISYQVQAIMETSPVASAAGLDAADDPAIWINKNDPDRSVIIGTDKIAGLYSYNLNGEVLQFIEAGELNNVDLRDGLMFNGISQVLIAASNRTLNTISLFLMDPDLLRISESILEIETSVDEVYGLCMYNDANNRFFIFVSGRNGQIEQYEITSNNYRIFYKFQRRFKVNSQAEGMVVNDLNSTLYIGVEQEGIYKTSARPNEKAQLSLIKESTRENNEFISYDIEGLAIYHSTNKNYLIASIQGNFSYAIFELGETDKYISSFSINAGLFDGVEETDGIELTSFPINAKYPKGMLVVQDGFNYDGDSLVSQNFKYISWKDIEDLL